MSGAQVWNGTADTLKAKPTMTNTMPSVMNGTLDGSAADLGPDVGEQGAPVTP